MDIDSKWSIEYNLLWIAEAVGHLQGARAPVGLLLDALGPALMRDAHGVVAARAGGRLVDVVVRHLAVCRVKDLHTPTSYVDAPSEATPS